MIPPEDFSSIERRGTTELNRMLGAPFTSVRSVEASVNPHDQAFL